MCARISDAWTKLRYAISKMTVVTTLTNFLVVQIVHLKVTATKDGDNRQSQTTLTGGGGMAKHQVGEQGPQMTTPLEIKMYVTSN